LSIFPQIKEFKEENLRDESELQFFGPTPSSPSQVKKARSIFRSTPGVNYINILRSNFLYERLFSSFFYVHVTREKLPKQRSYEKFVCKMLMKLTPASQDYDDGEFHPTPSAHFERARQEFESQQFESEFQPTPSTPFKQGHHSSPPFEPVRANVLPFEPDTSKYITPTEATLFEAKDNRLARQVKPEHYDYTERPVSRPEPYSSKPVYRPEFFNLGPVNPPESFSSKPVNRPETYNPRPVNPSEQRPVNRPETYNPRPENSQEQILANRPENYNPGPANPQDPRSANRPESLTENREENEIESFSSAFLTTPREIEKLHPSRDDLSTGRPGNKNVHFAKTL